MPFSLLGIVTKLNELSEPVARTVDPLGANGSYTSNVFSTAGWGRIVGSCFSDRDGVLFVEQSPDGQNFDVQSRFDYSAGSQMGFSVEVVCPFARVRFTNGSTAQTVFRLYVFLRRI